jgi:hypothetical protein
VEGSKDCESGKNFITIEKGRIGVNEFYHIKERLPFIETNPTQS